MHTYTDKRMGIYKSNILNITHNFYHKYKLGRDFSEFYSYKLSFSEPAKFVL